MPTFDIWTTRSTLWAGFLLLAPLYSGAQQLPEIRLVQQLRIDGNAHNLSTIDWVAVRRDSVLAVSQRQDRAVRFFDNAGRLLATVGRAGDGPGEFRTLPRAGWIADTLWVYDGPQRRFTLISPRNQYMRIVPVPVPARPPAQNPAGLPEYKMVLPKALYADGSVHAFAGSASGPLAARNDPKTSTYLRVRADGIIQKVLARHPVSDGDAVLREGTATAGVIFPFAIEPQYDVSPDGSRAALVMARVTSSPIVEISVTMFASNGDTLYSVRHNRRATAIPKSFADSVRDRNIAAFGRMNPTLVHLYRQRFTMPPVFPPATGIVVANDGAVWIRQFTQGSSVQYLVLDPRGATKGMVTLPANADVRLVDGASVWTVERDSLDVQSVVRYRVGG